MTNRSPYFAPHVPFLYTSTDKLIYSSWPTHSFRSTSQIPPEEKPIKQAIRTFVCPRNEFLYSIVVMWVTTTMDTRLQLMALICLINLEIITVTIAHLWQVHTIESPPESQVAIGIFNVQPTHAWLKFAPIFVCVQYIPQHLYSIYLFYSLSLSLWTFAGVRGCLFDRITTMSLFGLRLSGFTYSLERIRFRASPSLSKGLLWS